MNVISFRGKGPFSLIAAPAISSRCEAWFAQLLRKKRTLYRFRFATSLCRPVATQKAHGITLCAPSSFTSFRTSSFLRVRWVLWAVTNLPQSRQACSAVVGEGATTMLSLSPRSSNGAPRTYAYQRSRRESNRHNLTARTALERSCSCALNR